LSKSPDHSIENNLPRKLWRRESWSAEEQVLAAYGVLAVPTTRLAIGLGLLVWRDWLATLLASVLGVG